MERIDSYLCWPFTTKGHFHLPSGIAPVLMDAKARFHAQTSNNSFLFVPHSWNLAGKPATDQALLQITQLTRDQLHIDETEYENIVRSNLKDIMSVASSLVSQNIEKSKQLMQPLGLMESGLYKDKTFVPVEFRDDTSEYKHYIQERFIEWYQKGVGYFKYENEKPTFYLDIQKLYKERPFDKFIQGLNAGKETLNTFENNFDVYTKDLPISTIGGYGTPVPIYVDNYGNIEVPTDIPENFDPRLNTKHMNHLLIIKPLINCYLFADYLSQKFGGFNAVNIANDHHMATRINFVSLLLSERNYQFINLYIFNLLKDSDGNTFSFKNGVLQNMDELESKIRGLARFTIMKNIKLGHGDTKVNIDVGTLEKINGLLQQDKDWRESDIVYSKMFKKNVSVSEVVTRGIEKGNISQVLSFLIDALIQNPSNSNIRYYLVLLL